MEVHLQIMDRLVDHLHTVDRLVDRPVDRLVDSMVESTSTLEVRQVEVAQDTDLLQEAQEAQATAHRQEAHLVMVAHRLVAPLATEGHHKVDGVEGLMVQVITRCNGAVLRPRRPWTSSWKPRPRSSQIFRGVETVPSRCTCLAFE